MLACLPTLTHGFEYRNGALYSLAVGTPALPLAAPDPQRIHSLVIAWARHWAGAHLGDHPDACQRFLNAVQRVSPPNWESVAPESLVRNPDAAGGLVYTAIPALLATLLHTLQININAGAQTLRFRKVQGDGSDRTGLYLVSQPFRGRYLQENTEKGTSEEREGYFAYRVDFDVATQAGRFYPDGMHLKPWVFVRLSCQRYAHQELSGNFGRNLSVLMGIGRPRWEDMESDQTLVRLQLGKRGDDFTWLQELPALLEEAKARPLVKPEDLLRDRAGQYGVTRQSSDPWFDEYYVVHAEGYKYARRGHAIKTGFHFDERREVLTQLMEKLQGVLTSDDALPADRPIPTGAAVPTAMRGFEFMHAKTRAEHRSVKQLPGENARPRKAAKPNVQALLHERLKDVIFRLQDGQQVQLMLIYREQSTLDLMRHQIRKALFIPEEADLPDWLVVSDVPVTSAELLAHFDKLENKQQRRAHYRRQYDQRREAWQALLAARRLPKAKAVLAFIEITRPTVDAPRNIKGAIREACARLNISSQMLQSIPYRPDSQAKHSQPVLSRSQNAALDLLVRQPGLLYGSPSDAYAKAGLPGAVAGELDVVALYRRQHLDANVHCALAVRLRAGGEVDVQLPHEDRWIPYVEAGPALGCFFADKRRDNGRSAGDTIGLSLSPVQLAQFAARIVTAKHERPTLVLVEADVWRNEGKNPIWGQLKNNHLASHRDVLDFAHVRNQGHYGRADPALEKLVGVVRLRMNGETPHYLPAVAEEESAQDFKPLSGFVDRSAPELWHYFSVGRAPKTMKADSKDHSRGLYKLDVRSSQGGESAYGANTAFRHQQVVEMVPFFVRPEFQTDDGLLALCRVPHYLRASPAWDTGNTLLPFPLHLAKCLVDDYLCLFEN